MSQASDDALRALVEQVFDDPLRFVQSRPVPTRRRVILAG